MITLKVQYSIYKNSSFWTNRLQVNVHDKGNKAFLIDEVEIVNALKGNGSTIFFDLLEKLRTEEVGRRLGRSISKLDLNCSVQASIKDKLEDYIDSIVELDGSALLAPSTWQSLSSNTPLVAIEKLLKDIELDTELQKCKFPEKEIEEHSSHSRWNALGSKAIVNRGMFYSPVTPLGFHIDGFSSHALSDLEQVSGSHLGWQPLEYSLSIDLVSEACNVIKETSVGYSILVSRSTRVLVIRYDPENPIFRSASAPICNGRAVFHNPHLATVEQLVDAIIHESIHALLDIIELVSPFELDRSSEKVLCSPWSGRKLDLGTYIQACLIWFSVHGFWKKFNSNKPSDSSLILERRSARGFEGDILLSTNIPGLTDISISLMKLIAQQHK